eukprot:g12106.t1
MVCGSLSDQDLNCARVASLLFENILLRQKQRLQGHVSDILHVLVKFLSQVAIKKEEVLSVLKSIKVDKSPGPDGIYPRILRETIEQIAGASTDIFVSSLAT